MDSDSGDSDDFLDAGDIEGYGKKRREALEKKTKYKKFRREKGGGSTNKQKTKKKGYLMLRKSRQISNKIRTTKGDKDRRAKLVRKREHNFKKKHG